MAFLLEVNVSLGLPDQQFVVVFVIVVLLVVVLVLVVVVVGVAEGYQAVRRTGDVS